MGQVIQPSAIRPVKRLDRLARVAYADKCGRPPIQVNDFPEGRWLLDRAGELAIKDNAPSQSCWGATYWSIPPGKHFGKILDRCYEAQLDGAYVDAASGVHYLRKLVKEFGY